MKELKNIIIGCAILTPLIATPYCITASDPSWWIVAKTYTLTFVLCFVIWGGNVVIGHLSDRTYPWETSAVKHIVMQFGLSAIFSVVAVNFMISLFFIHWMIGGPFTMVFKWDSSLLAVFISFFIISAESGSHFFKKWKAALLESEKLKKETVQSQFEALKTQINPHFLFNSLNTLAAIIPEDKDKSVEFVEKLSKVYRYLMQYRDYDTIDLKTELNCADAYFFLQQTRFGENLIVIKDIDDKWLEKQLPPLSLQILAENAIKHNIISKNKPLTVKIYIVDKNLIVENNLQKKSVVESSTKVGLQNIKNRYEYIAQSDIIIEETNDCFRVKLPLLN